MNPSRYPVWAELAVLTAAFALSHAFRTVVTLVAMSLRSELALGNETIGLVGAAFHITFGVMQLPMGLALDLYGPRRVVAVVFPVAVGGAILTVLSSDAQSLVAGQLLIGLGCSPVFLAALVIIGRSYPPEQFSRLSGIVLGVGGAGMLITGTPMAWLVDAWSWRAAYLVLALASLVAWALALRLLSSEPFIEDRQGQTFAAALQQTKAILVEPQTMGIIALGAVTYASFISLRGLWLVPLLTDRHGLTLIESGHVALAGSIVVLFGPPLFGRVDPGGRKRRRLIVGCTIVYAGLFALLASGTSATSDVVLTVIVSGLAGYFVLQYADVQSSFAPAVLGRASAIFNTSMFLGVAGMQWISGLAASAASEHGMDPLCAALWIISVLLLIGAGAFVFLPSSKHSPSE
jgi:predicted MFS family arabinose efflux permease